MLWYRNLSVGSPINGFLVNVRYDVAEGGDSGAGVPPGGAGEASKGDAQAAAAAAVAATPPDWRTGLDPEIKDHPCLKDFKSEKEVVKSYVSVQRLIGVDKLPIPPADAKPEVREKFLNDVYDRLGRPKEAKDYKLSEIKLPDGVKFNIDPKGVDVLKTEAHKLGLLPHQLDGLYKWYMTDTANKVKAYNENIVKERQDSEAALRSEFGAAYDGKIAKAQELLNKFGGNDYKQLLDSGFGNNPAVIRFMSKMAEAISEDTFEKGGGEVTMTPDEAKKEAAKVTQQLVNMQQSDPEYKDLLKRKRELYEMAYVDKKG